MKNNVIIATALNDHVRIYLINSTKMVEDARVAHDLYPTSAAALGRTMSVTALMGMMQKDENEQVSVTINGGGPIGTVMCAANSNGHVKGFCGDPHFYETYPNTHKLAVGVGVGRDGYLKVTKNLKLKQNYTSQVALQSGEIGDDFAYYFAVSEQRPTICSVGVLVNEDYTIKAAGAMIIELLPNHLESDVQYLEGLKLEHISSVIEKDPDLSKYLYQLFPDADILKEAEVMFHCDCSRERIMTSLLTLSKSDLDELSQDDHIDIKCEFCNKEYSFNKKDIETIMKYAAYKK